MNRWPWAWSVGQQVGRQIVSYTIFIILARLLSPQDFGLVALAAAWIGILGVFSEVGFGSALVQRAEVTSAHLSSTFALNSGLGLLASGLGMLASWPMARLLDAPRAQPVMLVLSAGFFINAVSLTHMAIAYRELRFRELAIRDLSATLIGGVVGVTAAFQGAGVWSLVAQTLVTAAAGSLLLWRILPWRPSGADISSAALRELWAYSSKLFAFNVFKYFAQNADKLIVGALAGPIGLGFYNFAQKLVLVPIQSLVGAVGNWLFPRLSRLQADPAHARRVYLRTCSTVALVLFPPLAVLAVVAEPGIVLIFGAKWAPGAEIVPIFALVAAAVSLMAMAGPLLKAFDRPGWLFNWSVFFSALVATALFAGNRWGLPGLACGLGAAHLIGLFVLDRVSRPLLALGSGGWLKTAAPGLGLAALAAGAAAATLRLPQLSPGLGVGLASLVAAGVYGAGLWRLKQTLSPGEQGDNATDND